MSRAGHLRPHRGWLTSAREGLAGPALHAAALTCFSAAVDALPRIGAPSHVRAAVVDFVERYVVPGRCPADDRAPTAVPRYGRRPAIAPG